MHWFVLSQAPLVLFFVLARPCPGCHIFTPCLQLKTLSKLEERTTTEFPRILTLLSSTRASNLTLQKIYGPHFEQHIQYIAHRLKEACTDYCYKKETLSSDRFNYGGTQLRQAKVRKQLTTAQSQVLSLYHDDTF